MSTTTALFYATAINAVKRDDLPTLVTTTSSSSSAVSTPSMYIPAATSNPYIIKVTNPSGTVFIAVGAIVGAILLGFILYNLIVSITASRTAKNNNATDKQMYEKYQHNNSKAYGAPAAFNGSDSKLPYLNHRNKSMLSGLGGNQTMGGSLVGDTSTIYASESGAATSKHDLTKMFFSPTADVMQHKRMRSSGYLGGGSTTNLSIFGSTTGAPQTPVGGSQAGGSVPNLAMPQRNTLYINNEGNNSDYSIGAAGAAASHGQTGASPNALQPRSTRKTIPSMYLEDLMDGETKD